MIEAEPVRVVPERVCRMLFIEGYFKEFWRLVQEGATHAAAYEEMEKELTKYGFPGRYDSYESFKRGKYYYSNLDSPLKFF